MRWLNVTRLHAQPQSGYTICCKSAANLSCQISVHIWLRIVQYSRQVHLIPYKLTYRCIPAEWAIQTNWPRLSNIRELLKRIHPAQLNNCLIYNWHVAAISHTCAKYSHSFVYDTQVIHTSICTLKLHGRSAPSTCDNILHYRTMLKILSHTSSTTRPTVV